MSPNESDKHETSVIVNFNYQPVSVPFDVKYNSIVLKYVR